MMERKEPDRWGYTRYAVVLFLPEEERRKVDALRARLPIPVAMIPAHVTVKGSFDSPEDLPKVYESYINFRKQAIAWGNVSERPYLNARGDG